MNFKENDLICHKSGKERIREIEFFDEKNAKYRFRHPFGNNNFTGFGEIKDLKDYELVEDIPHITGKNDIETINKVIDKVNLLNKLLLG